MIGTLGKKSRLARWAHVGVVCVRVCLSGRGTGRSELRVDENRQQDPAGRVVVARPCAWPMRSLWRSIAAMLLETPAGWCTGRWESDSEVIWLSGPSSALAFHWNRPNSAMKGSAAAAPRVTGGSAGAGGGSAAAAVGLLPLAAGAWPLSGGSSGASLLIVGARVPLAGRGGRVPRAGAYHTGGIGFQVP